jgi:hypothetical protein
VTAVEAEGVFHGFIDERLSFEAFDDLVHVNDQGTVGGSGNLQQLDRCCYARSYMRSIVPDRIFPVNVGAFHAVRPRHVIGEQGKDTLHVPSFRSIVNLMNHLLATIHLGASVRH